MADHIPTKFVVFAEAVAKLAADAGLNSVSITARDGWGPGVDDHWPADVRVTWSQGRHGEDARKLHIESTINVRHTFKQEPSHDR